MWFTTLHFGSCSCSENHLSRMVQIFRFITANFTQLDECEGEGLEDWGYSGCHARRRQRGSVLSMYLLGLHTLPSYIPQMPVIAIYNPICGDGTAWSFFNDHVLPLLSKHGKKIDKVASTMYQGHAGELVFDFIKEQARVDITVILGSGDGTLHEIINFLSANLISKIHFAIVPCGTANAMFASLFPPEGDFSASNTEYKLQSVKSYIHSIRVVPLTLAIATLSSHPDPRRIISSVVMSTSLHASILRDSESLRNKMPGIER